MRRSTQQPAPPSDSTCDSLKPHFSSVAAFNDYKSSRFNTEAIGNYISGQLASDLAGTTPDSTAEEMEERVQTNVDNLLALENKVHQFTRCLQTEITRRSEKAGDIYRLQDEVVEQEKEADAMERTAKEAKERAGLLHDPYSKTNRHELWFPLGRPMKSESVPVLLSLSILFLVLALGMFLRLANIEFKLTAPFLGGYNSFSRYTGGT